MAKPPGRLTMASSEISLPVGGSAMSVFVAAPDGPGPHPAALIAHHRGGVDEFTRHVAERVASLGGETMEYHVLLDPTKLAGAGLSVGDVSTAEITDATPAVLASHISQRGCQGPRQGVLLLAGEVRDVQAGEGQGFGHAIVDGAFAGTHFGALLEELLHLGMDVEVFRVSSQSAGEFG